MGNRKDTGMNRVIKIIIMTIVSMGIAAGSLYYYFELPPSESPIHFQNLQIVHKGGSPENTFKAIRASHKQGVKAIELDVQLTKDNHLILFHDQTLERMTDGFGKAADHTLAELKALKVDKTETIPTLEEAIELIIALDMKVELDIRNSPHHATIAKKIDALFQKYDLYERIFVSSFNPRITYAIRSINPKIITAYGFIQSATDYAIIDFFLRSSFIPHILGAGIIEPHWKILTPEMISYWTRKGFLLNPWTINTKEQKALIKKLGITTYVTNCFDTDCEEDLYDKDKLYGLSSSSHLN
jgi:glycerophosphoryl diester phosphodiesterase